MYKLLTLTIMLLSIIACSKPKRVKTNQLASEYKIMKFYSKKSSNSNLRQIKDPNIILWKPISGDATIFGKTVSLGIVWQNIDLNNPGKSIKKIETRVFNSNWKTVDSLIIASRQVTPLKTTPIIGLVLEKRSTPFLKKSPLEKLNILDQEVKNYSNKNIISIDLVMANSSFDTIKQVSLKNDLEATLFSYSEIGKISSSKVIGSTFLLLKLIEP